MVTLSAFAATRKALAAVGGSNVPGYCLAWVYSVFGSVQSIGPGAGHFSTALDGWNYAQLKHLNDYSPPAGVPVYFGVSPTRTDRNKRAGDVTVSLGGGRVAATDYPYGGRIGTLTIAQRAAQTQRPYLGWTGDFLGHLIAYTHPTGTITAGTGITTVLPTAALNPIGDSDMFVLENTSRGWFTLVAKQYVRHLAETDAQLVAKVVSESDEIHKLSDSQVATVFAALNIPIGYRDPTNSKVKKTRVWSK